MTKNEIQNKAISLLKENNYTGTCNISTGGGKSKIAIECIKQGNFKNILITSPRTNLKENWKQELNKWGIKGPLMELDNWLNNYQVEKKSIINITLENIQTCYKWRRWDLSTFDLIIVDEIHTIITEEYGKLIVQAKSLNIPIIGLTATPDDDKQEKKDFYAKYIPIIYRYKDGAEDGIINKRRHLVLEYELDNLTTIPVVTAKKTFRTGEKKQYEYYDKTMKEASDFIKNHYFEGMKKRYDSIKLMREDQYPKAYITLLNDALSKDLNYFYEVINPMYENKSMPRDVYWLVKEIKDFNYSFLGLNAQKLTYNKSTPKEIKPYIFKYIYAMNKRKEFLWNLDSSAIIAKQLKREILKNPDNKVLIFSERTEHVEKITTHTIHSKKHTKKNKELLDQFNSNEIKELGSCHSLGLGLNLTGVNYEIVESFSGSDVSLTQRLGRSDRLEVDDVATIIIIVPKSTQSSVWFQTAATNIQNIQYYSNLKELIKDL